MDRLDDIVHRYCDEATDWHLVTEDGPNSVSYRPVSRSNLMVRTSFVGNTPFASAVASLRPEALCGEAQRYHWRNISEAFVVKSFGVGDVLGWIRFAKQGVLAKQALLHSQSMVFDQDNLEGAYYRVRLHRDCPVPGATTLLMAPVDMDRYQVCEVLGMHRAATLTLIPEDGGAKTRLTKVVSVSQKLLWTLPLMMPQRVCPSVAIVVPREAVTECRALEEKAGFIVLRMRKCSGGPPLVPSGMPCVVAAAVAAAAAATAGKMGVGFVPLVPARSATWVPAAVEQREFQTAGYLQRLLQVCGLGHLEVFDSLDQRRLVFYQAAVRRCDWPHIWAVLEPLLREHRFAYRQLYRCTTGPHLDVDVQPRFADTPWSSHSDSSECAEDLVNGARCSGANEAAAGEAQSPRIMGLAEWPNLSYAVKNTFLHFPTRDYDEDELEQAMDETLSQP